MRARVVAGVVVVLAPLAGAARCEGGEHVAKDCSVSFAGLHVSKGLIADTVPPTCDVRPQDHTIQVQVQIEVGGQWLGRGRAVTVVKVPDQTGFTVHAQTPCTEGDWRTEVYVQGTGPNGDPFQHTEHGDVRHFALVQCAG